MRIGFDATSLTHRRSGIGRYSAELLAALTRVEPDDEYVLLANRRSGTDGALDVIGKGTGRARVSRLRGPGLPTRIGWMQTFLPVELAATAVDVCHFTNYHAPLLARGPMVVTFHDLSLLLAPTGHPPRRVATMRPLLRRVARRADAVITPSDSVRTDVIRLLGLDPARVNAIPEAAAPMFRPVTDQAELERVAAAYGVEAGFLLFVGTVEPRKNLLRLADAYSRMRHDGCTRPLLLVGQLGWSFDALLARIEEPDLRGVVRMLGYVPDSDLPALYSLCGAFVYPSLMEGFGLPIVEAMACGAPTVTSDRGAMREVAGDAALLVDPTDVLALASALSCAMTDEPTRARLRAAGPARAASFTWEAAAHRTAAVYRSVVEARA